MAVQRVKTLAALSGRLLPPFGPNSLGSNEIMKKKKKKKQHLWLLEESRSRKLIP